VVSHTNLLTLKEQSLIVIERYRKRAFEFALKEVKYIDLRKQINLYHYEQEQAKKAIKKKKAVSPTKK